MSKDPPVVAELGRPETPEETAARKAEFSRTYRASQNFRNLIAALLATLAVVAVIVFGVPRGQVAERPPLDLTGIAAEVEKTMERPVIVPEVPDDWAVNGAELQSGPVTAWDVVLAPQDREARGFVRLTQGFDADVSWAPLRLNGTAPVDTVDVDGRTWDAFTLRNPEQSGNVSYALGTQAGPDYVLLYGSLGPELTAELAASLAPQLDALEDR